MHKVLVTGGCGYIGSHSVVDLVEKGFEVISIDNLYNARPDVIDRVSGICGRPVRNERIDIQDLEALEVFFEREGDIASIVHFAAYKSVEESVREPLKYFRNNVGGLLNLASCVQKFRIPNFIFSSSCTVYGQPDRIPVTEEAAIKEAASPYGRSKQISEYILQDLARALPWLRVILLRYFNPAGAHESGLIGEEALIEVTNLVPIITEAAIGKRDRVTVFGTDYDTRDGSCIRDYIHVMDLAEAHTLALQYILDGKMESGTRVFNLGIGEGVTVLEAIRAFEEVSGIELNVGYGDRRAGDVVKIYADASLAERELGWTPARDVRDIMRSAWRWEQNRGHNPS